MPRPRRLAVALYVVSGLVCSSLALRPGATASTAPAVGPTAAAGPAAALAPVGLQSGTCRDTRLGITMDRPVVLGATGRLDVHRSDGAIVDSIDLADPTSRQRTIGGATSDFGEPHLWNYEPVSVDGAAVTIQLHRTL